MGGCIDTNRRKTILVLLLLLRFYLEHYNFSDNSSGFSCFLCDKEGKKEEQEDNIFRMDWPWYRFVLPSGLYILLSLFDDLKIREQYSS